MGTYSSLKIEELTQLCLTSRDSAAWEEFVRRYHKLIAKVIIRTAAQCGNISTETVDDLIQETYLKFCLDDYRALREFVHEHEGAFNKYVQVLASNVARDHFKSLKSIKRGAAQIQPLHEDLNAPVQPLNFGSSQTIERSVLIEELQAHLPSCAVGSDRQQSIRIFWLHYRVGLSARAIASLPGIALEEKGIESILLRMRSELQRRITKGRLARTIPDQTLAEGILPADSL